MAPRVNLRPDDLSRALLTLKFWPRLHALVSNSGWELSFSADADSVIDPRLRLAAAVFRIELDRRFGS